MDDVFQRGLAQIRHEHDVPESFPAEAEADARAAASRPLDGTHIDRTDVEFVTLDPASSTDLDQAFTIERSGPVDLLLRYAIADVPWFVSIGGALDIEAWRRGVTTYLPDGRVPLYPQVLSEAAASLLPDGPRPAVIFIVRVRGDGETALDGVERAVIRSRAKLSYEHATADDLPGDFDELARRIRAAEDRRGASRVDTPEQQIEPDGQGGYRLSFRPRLANEDTNAALSLATNLAVADALLAAGTGLFRVMADPDERALHRLRFTAKALDLEWPAAVDLRLFQRQLDPNDHRSAAFLLAVRRATGGASYASFAPGPRPWHSAMAATYCHATAPLRRLADRYVVDAALDVANGRSPSPRVSAAFSELPKVMDKAENAAAQIDRAVIEFVETVVLAGHERQAFRAIVTDVDDRGARFQLCDAAVTSRVAAHHVEPGDEITVRLISADPVKRSMSFERVG